MKRIIFALTQDKMKAIFKSKTTIRLFKYFLEEKITNKSYSELAKDLRYKNKSSICRGIQALLEAEVLKKYDKIICLTNLVTINL